MTGGVKVDQLAALLALQSANRRDFSCVIQVGESGLLFQFQEFHPGPIGHLHKHVQQPLFDKSDVEAQPIAQFLVGLREKFSGVLQVAAQIIGYFFRFLLR